MPPLPQRLRLYGSTDGGHCQGVPRYQQEIGLVDIEGILKIWVEVEGESVILKVGAQAPAVVEGVAAPSETDRGVREPEASAAEVFNDALNKVDALKATFNRVGKIEGFLFDTGHKVFRPICSRTEGLIVIQQVYLAGVFPATEIFLEGTKRDGGCREGGGGAWLDPLLDRNRGSQVSLEGGEAKEDTMENAQSEEEGNLADTKQAGHDCAVLSESNFLLKQGVIKQYKQSININ